MSKGPVSRPILSDELFAVLEQELAKGPVAHGWPDQTWTLARIATLIGRVVMDPIDAAEPALPCRRSITAKKTLATPALITPGCLGCSTGR